MTALNFRKNVREFLPWVKTTAQSVTKECQSINASEKLHDIRCRAAALMMPDDMAFIITPKQDI